MSYKLYVDNKDEYRKRINKEYLNAEPARIEEVENAIILPLKVINNSTTDGIFAGGVIMQDNKFVAGIKRHKDKAGNLSCMESYDYDKNDIKVIDEEVIFGGIIIEHFGHSFLESLSRLWYVIKNKKDKRKIVFLLTGEMKDYHYEMLELLKIKKNRITILQEPTQYKKVVIPEETIHAWDSYKEEYNIIYDEIRRNTQKYNFEKLYLTRSKLIPNYDVNEKFFEEFFEKKGYKVLSPEKLSFKEQMKYIVGAKEVVTTLGTLSHLALCMDYGSKIVILNRSKKNNLIPQFIINECRKIDTIYIDALLEFLPIEHSGGCVCLYPTQHFIEYLESEKIYFDSNEIMLDKNNIIVEYLKKWSENYNNSTRYSTIEKKDLYDVIKTLNKELNNIEINKEDIFPKGSTYHLKNYWINNSKENKEEIKKLNEEIEQLKNKIKILEKKYNKIVNSKSWKIICKIRKLIKRKKVTK